MPAAMFSCGSSGLPLSSYRVQRDSVSVIAGS